MKRGYTAEETMGRPGEVEVLLSKGQSRGRPDSTWG